MPEETISSSSEQVSYFDKEFEVKSHNCCLHECAQHDNTLFKKNIRSFAFGRMRGHVSKIHPCNGCKYNQACMAPPCNTKVKVATDDV